MKKKMIVLTLILATFVLFLSTNIIVADDEVILSPTIVNLHKDRYDMPMHFYKDKGIETYLHKDKEGTIIGEFYDFRGYFEILDNRQIILDMHRSIPVDEGGYTIDIGEFDLDVPGDYDITLTYEGLSSTESKTITVKVIDNDITPPEIYLPDYRFNITKTEEQFLNEIEKYLNQTRVYDLADGIIPLTIANFPEEEINKIRNAKLKDVVELVLTVSDKAGNEITKTANLTIDDILNPTILNIETLITKKNKPIKVTAHLEFFDNYSEPEEIEKIYKFYGTLVHKNEWVKGSRRANENKGEIIGNYVRIDDINELLEDVKIKQGRGYDIGDYYEVTLNGIKNFVYIAEKEVDKENPNMRNNVWLTTTDETIVKGKVIESYDLLVHGNGLEFKSWLDDNKEDDHNIHDYVKVRDIIANEVYYIYIVTKDRVFRDEQLEIDFSKEGVQYVIVTAIDEANNTATADFRVVIENSISLTVMLLIINGVLFIGVGAIVLLLYVRPIILNRKKGESNK